MIPFRANNVTLVQMDPSLNHAELDFGHVLFLDFDGVLHPEGCAERDHFCYLPNFCEALRVADRNGSMPLVISSLWRHHCTLDQIRANFPQDLKKRIVGVTPYMTDAELQRISDWAPYGGEQSRNCHRQREVLMWMNAHAPTGNWLAIDDRAVYFHKDTPNLFLVPKLVYQGNSGITIYQKDALVQRLRGFLETDMPQAF
jgi:HAD domain in Swiss Army Knife RNA repair proteins